jgi:hypothetical protein
MLKAELVYDTPMRHWYFELIPSRTSFDEVRQHDPLVVIANFFFPAPLLEANDRLKILEAFYDARLQAQERLCSGKDLETVHVATQTRIYPGYRLAYTEKTLTIQPAQRPGAQRVGDRVRHDCLRNDFPAGFHLRPGPRHSILLATD